MRHVTRTFLAGGLMLVAAACGGGGGGGSGGSGGVGAPTGGGAGPPAPVRISDDEAARFLTQATFGPTGAEIVAVRDANNLAAWINAQQALPPGPGALATLDARLAEMRVTNPNANLSANSFYEHFWRQAATGQDQLRQRVTFALSQIFVISFADSGVEPRGVASYYDMLNRNAFGNYRTLLREVSLHPMMGRYLTHLGNQKEDPNTGRTPDENFAREILQLMSIGLYALNLDGSVQRDASGAPIPTYSSADVSNLAKVFTGFGWHNATPSNSTFFGGQPHPDRTVLPMIGYPNFHSTSAKTFLGATIPATTVANPMGDLDAALDIIFNHPNVGPFVARQMIQRLVTSNPSAGYIQRVATVFNNNGSGVRGDMGAVVRAVLLDTEARTGGANSAANQGKIREPVLRLSAWMRAFGATSTSGNWSVGSTSASTSLGQSPMTSPSVFNFFRPGYSPPNTKMGGAGLVAPEMQIVDEVTTAGYLNTIYNAVVNGIGSGNDVKANYAAEIALADNPAALADHLDTLLLHGTMTAGTRQKLIDAVTSVAIPAGANVTQTQIDAAKLNRARLGVVMAMASPDFIVQR
jgi:uncharacterized protein (DUF1800 family)